MKKITWMEIAMAMPMALTFSTFGGTTAIAVTSAIMLVMMVVVKWVVKERQELKPVPVTHQKFNTPTR